MEKIWSTLLKLIWVTAFVLIGAIVISANFFPHGPIIGTGWENDNGVEVRIEDTRRLNVPSWVKFVRYNRRHIAFIIVFVLPIAGMYVSKKKEDNIDL